MLTKEAQLHILALPSIFLWIGFVCAISFMEAWVKFRAPGVTLPLGLGIGSLVFKALNKAEWVFAILMAVDLFLLHRGMGINLPRVLFLIALLILIIQTLWLLPALDARIPLYQQGLEVPSSPLHFYYVGTEVVKVICLFITGIHFLRSIRIIS
ncbi:putative membrane protein [Proteiniphilum saccharofermentans]|jgi:hypothetical protein|uniref:Putative membrane protein n=1 Tax=Proteiniphilum saccharofermentans TaxID=1642647 RepID=A0A1R3SYI6_9BACT|nr:hypothetical protein [Proteiniphilum saccharofermentans]SCD21253.1 putative membrane protein [Proteiniphilum saccharofermentans]SDZ85596.1 hypothetical protein SAMN05216331_10723 [Porphyromonadaceae bacterium KH3R12]SFK72486.1 hypothetical protein SAMN05216357_10578 [Porphyromonadaceae bacterium KH3CP3RA]SFT00917.1 hypothetical protein SAMN05216365_14128 [Porphyromonadaceae bacterium NLAE-zl-C104]